MRDAHKAALKKVKQQILAFCLRNGFQFTAGKKYWTKKHVAWLKALKMDEMLREVLDEYLATYQASLDKIERFDRRIEELASNSRYAEKVKMLSCFIGIRTHTALSLLVETGDFRRFAKAGNSHLRRKFYHLTLKLKKKRNIAIAAVARELSCFIWGMMTEHIA